MFVTSIKKVMIGDYHRIDLESGCAFHDEMGIDVVYSPTKPKNLLDCFDEAGLEEVIDQIVDRISSAYARELKALLDVHVEIAVEKANIQQEYVTDFNVSGIKIVVDEMQIQKDEMFKKGFLYTQQGYVLLDGLLVDSGWLSDKKGGVFSSGPPDFYDEHGHWYSYLLNTKYIPESLLEKSGIIKF